MVFSISIGTVSAAGPTADFTGNVTTGTAPLTVKFTDESTGNPDGWAWYFGDETYEGEWERVNESAWPKRYDHSSVVMPDGSIVLMGGYDVDSDAYNDTWRSDDYGTTWECVNESSGWMERLRHSSVVMPDGNIILMGGSGGPGTLKDIWRSDDGGKTWTCVNPSAEWTKRAGHTSVVMPDGSIVIMGGGGVGYNDTWRSTDGGETWTQLPDAGWTGRYYHTGVVMPDGGIVIMGGTYWDGNSHHFLNDVWQSDDYGGNWTQLPDAEWSKRDGHSSVVMPDGSIVIMGGGDDTTSLDDTWRSTDNGTIWTQLPDAGWTGRYYHTSVVMPDGSIIIMGGWDEGMGVSLNDVWRLKTAGNQTRNPTHTYTEPGTYTVTLQAYNDDGHNVTQKVAYITVTPPPPEAGFSATPLSGPAPLTVKFTDESTGDPDGWTWYFGDETYEGPWERVNESAWPKRLLHDSVALPDGSIVIMGGIASGSTRVNDTWRSTDRGATWTQLPDANWTVRNGHAAVALPDGSIVLMGGVADGSKCQNDTWRSDDYGASWTLMNASSGWMGREFHSSVALPDENIIIMGGNNGDKYLNDIWRSADRGATWTQVTEHAEWTARYGNAAVALPDGSIVLTGGEESYEYLNDTWRSTDGGATWTQVTEHAEWTGRRYHTAVAMPDGSTVLMGGNGGEFQDDVWRSTDGGATWTLVNASAWPARSMFASVVMPDGSIILMGGFNNGYRNDVWRLQPAGSTAENPTHTYTEPGTYTVTLQAYNDFGFDSLRKSITVTSPSSSGGGGGGGGSTVGPGGGYNVGGDSAVSAVTATGTGLTMLIVTGWKQSSPAPGIPPAPGSPYQYIELTPARFEEITGANITFSIPTAWLAEQGFAPDEIVLYRYNGTAWEPLPTWVVDDAGATVTFRAASPGFSLFAISGVRDERAVATPTAAETATQTTAQLTATETVAVPVDEAAPDFPLGMVALIAGGVLVLAGAGYFTRRWWIRRQNSALFRDYD